jgi:hypothetical protein
MAADSPLKNRRACPARNSCQKQTVSHETIYIAAQLGPDRVLARCLVSQDRVTAGTEVLLEEKFEIEDWRLKIDWSIADLRLMIGKSEFFFGNLRSHLGCKNCNIRRCNQ